MSEYNNSNNAPQLTYTLNQFIALKDADDITYSKYSVMERSLDNPELVYSIDNLIYNYMDEMLAQSRIVVISKAEQIKYMYKPKLLAYTCYGSTESYFVLMALNGVCNVKEFDLADLQFRALYPNDLSVIMSSIYNAESEFMTANRQNLKIYES